MNGSLASPVPLPVELAGEFATQEIAYAVWVCEANAQSLRQTGFIVQASGSPIVLEPPAGSAIQEPSGTGQG